MVFTRKKSRAGANQESPAKTHTGTIICEVRTTRRTILTHEYNDLFIQ